MAARWLLTVTSLLATAGAATPTLPPPAPLTTVALDLTGLSEGDWKQLDALSLEKRVVLRLVQDGFAVVAPSANADVRVSVTRTATGLQLAAHSRARDAQVEVAVGAEGLPELHLEIAQHSAELARTCAPPPPVLEPPAPAPPPPKQIGLSFGGALGFMVRAGGTDPAVRLVVRYGQRVGAELMIGLLPSGVSAVTVFELPVMLGLSLRLELGRGFALEGALAAGVLIHTFILSDLTAADRVGVRVDAVASVPITLAYFPLSWLGIGLRVAPGVASGTRNSDGWTRGAWWFEANGLAFLRF